MRVKKDRSHKIIVEMNAAGGALPPIALPELRLRHILAPVDFSDCSHKAVEYAISFAKQFSADILLLHVVVTLPPPPQLFIFEAEGLRGKYYEEAARHLGEWREEVLSHAAAVKSTVRESTSAYQEIVAVARDCNTDLIIIGNHGRSAMARMLMGSTAEKVVRHAPCPVLVVRGNEHEFLVTADTVTPSEKSAVA